MSVIASSPCEIKETEEPCESMFSSQEEKDKCLSKFCDGSLYCVGKIWIQSLRSFLLGVKFCSIPSVKAAAVKKDPERPLPMKPSELPAYASPHAAYKNFLEDQTCCDSHLIRDMVLPYVKDTRQTCQNVFTNIKTELCSVCKEIKSDISSDKKRITAYWRDDNNLLARRGLMATGGLIGYYFGSKGGIPRRILYVACAEAATGMLCFPKETDETIRSLCYTAGKPLLRFLNFMTGRDIELRERIPCPKPKPPDEKFVILCSEKKK